MLDATKFFVILGQFSHFEPPNNPKKSKFWKKWKKSLEILSFYTCVQQMTVIWCMVHEILSATDIIFCHFELFFTLLTPQQPRKSKFWKNGKNIWRYYNFTHVYHKWKSCDVWFPRYKAWQTIFFVILGHFLPLYPNNNENNQNFEKMKKNA